MNHGTTAEPRSSVLRRFAAEVSRDGRGARDRLIDSLRAASGPLIEPVPGQSDVMLVTFVLMARTEPAYVCCQLLPDFPVETEMLQITGAPDVWWAETLAPADVSTVYHFQDQPVPEPQGATRYDPEAVADYSRDLYHASYADPLNPARCYPLIALGLDPSPEEPIPAEKWQSILRLPATPVRGLSAPLGDRGALTQWQIRSAVLDNSRTVTVWSPPTALAEEHPILFLLDGESFLHGMDATDIFDRMTADGLTRPFTAVLVHNASPKSRLTEYLCNPSFAAFVTDELIPQIKGDAPGEVLIGGFSLGGLAASHVALNRPDLIDGVLALSPSLWWTPDNRPEWLTRQFNEHGPVRTRFWLEVGTLETEPISSGDTQSAMIGAARRLRDVLAAGKGHLIGYCERPGGHDNVNWSHGLAAGLSGLLASDTTAPIPSHYNTHVSNQ